MTSFFFLLCTLKIFYFLRLGLPDVRIWPDMSGFLTKCGCQAKCENVRLFEICEKSSKFKLKNSEILIKIPMLAA